MNNILQTAKKGNSNLPFLISLLILAAACYVALKLGEPYLAYLDLQKKMNYWADFDFSRGNTNFSDLRKNLKEVIDEHQIPLNIDDIQIEFDEIQKTLRVSAEYDVYVEFPGYDYYFHFSPTVEIEK